MALAEGVHDTRAPGWFFGLFQLLLCQCRWRKGFFHLVQSTPPQHRLKREKPLSQAPPGEPGFRGFAVGVPSDRFEKLRSEAARESEDEVWGARLNLKDPDGTDVAVVVQRNTD